jgi:type I restriction enzyme S subunit
MTGTSGRQRVQTDIVADLEIPLPLLPTQRAIAATLSCLDDAIENNRRLCRTLEETAEALFMNIFEKEKNIKTKPLYDFAEFINGTSFDKDEYSVNREGLPIIKIAELKNGITESTEFCNVEKEEKYYISNKDILFSWSGNPDTSIDIFIWAGGRGILNQHTFRVIPPSGQNGFIYFLLKSFKPEFTRIAHNKQTTGLGHVTVKDLQRLTFDYSSNAIQEFSILTNPIFDEIYSGLIESSRLTTIRDALLPRLLSGEIEVEGEE